MIQSSTYRQIWSFLLLLCFLIPFGIREMHHIADHVAEQAHCEADGNNKHIHGEEFAAHHCHLCAIQISKYFPQEFELAATKPNFLLSNIIYESQVFIPHSPAFSYQQRGPPLSAKA